VCRMRRVELTIRRDTEKREAVTNSAGQYFFPYARPVIHTQSRTNKVSGDFECRKSAIRQRRAIHDFRLDWVTGWPNGGGSSDGRSGLQTTPDARFVSKVSQLSDD